jgi:hypothetical protein
MRLATAVLSLRAPRATLASGWRLEAGGWGYGGMGLETEMPRGSVAKTESARAAGVSKRIQCWFNSRPFFSLLSGTNAAFE